MSQNLIGRVDVAVTNSEERRATQLGLVEAGNAMSQHNCRPLLQALARSATSSTSKPSAFVRYEA